MKTLESILSKVKKPGSRLTPVRKAVVSVLAKSKKPICAEGVVNRLVALKLRPNKTTVYRELDYLVSRGLVQELDFGAGRKCYEWGEGHHHHLVCRKCHRIEELEVHEMEPAFAKFEKGLSRKSGFAELSHSLEFYGVCKQCR